MRFRGLLVAAALLVVLGGLVWWSNKHKESEASKPAADAPPKIVSIPEDQVKRVEIKKTGAPLLILDRASGQWAMLSPEKYRVDQDGVNSLITAVSSLSSDRLVDEKATDLAAYGLNNPSMDVSITKKDGKTQELQIGDETPTSGGYFAKLQGDPRVFTIASYAKTSIDKSPADLRDKRLLTFDSDKLARLELVAKGQDIEFGRNAQNEWQIVKPKPMRADGGKVEELIRKLKEAKMDVPPSPEDAKKVSGDFGKATPLATVKVTDAAGTQDLQVRQDKDKNLYARSSVVDGVCKVSGAGLADDLGKSLEDFRNKKLFDFGWNDPSKIEVRQSGATTVFQKSGEKWTSGGKELDTATVQAVVDKLRDLSATKFADQGFSAPVLDVAVTSSDGKKVEKAELAQQAGKRDNEPTVYLLDPNAVPDLQKALGAVKQAKPDSKKK